jgi:hypothetical protein
MHTFTTTANVYLSPYSALDAQSAQRADNIEHMSVWDDAYCPDDYTLIGKAELTITIASPDTITANKVGALRLELEKDRAQSQMRQNKMEEQIQQLLAITHEASDVAPAMA